jgi:serine/threonine protein kinase
MSTPVIILNSSPAAPAFSTIASVLFAAVAMGQQSGRSVSPSGIKRFIDDLMAYQPSQRPSSKEIDYVQELLKSGRSVINSPDSVSQFASQTKSTGVPVIGKLADISTIDIPDVRVNATLLLADLAENRTVCGVLNKLMDKELVDKSRYNLLQVVKVVSNRLKNREVQSWIQSVVVKNRELVKGSSYDSEKTTGLLFDIERNINTRNVTDSLEKDYPESFQQCEELNNMALMQKQ